jgi:hypothetical protein
MQPAQGTVNVANASAQIKRGDYNECAENAGLLSKGFAVSQKCTLPSKFDVGEVSARGRDSSFHVT